MSTLRGLIRLIKAKTGTEGGGGQSFSGSVASASGASMAQYKINDPVWSNEPSDVTVYPSSSTFTDLTLTLNEYNARASEIHETTTGSWTVSYISPYATATATLNSISWATDVGTLNLTINGELTPTAGTPTVTIWYQGYNSPYLPYGGTGNTDPQICIDPNPPYTDGCTTAYDVNFTFSVGQAAASGSSVNTLYLSYAPDDYGAAFNPTIYGKGPTVATGWDITQNRRAGIVSTIDAVQWSDDSGFSNIVSSSNPLTISSDNNTVAGPYYLRYKLDGAADWTNYAGNPVSWTDPRDDS